MGFSPPRFGSAMMLKPMVLNALTTRAPGAQAATCSPPELLASTESPERSGNRGLVASIKILPLRLPADSRAARVVDHGVARTTTSLFAAASATEAARADDPASCKSFL